MFRRRSVLALAAAALIALPSSALAQNAGDQQYSDPLAPGTGQGGGGGGGSSGGPGGGSGGGSQGGAGNTQAQQAPSSGAPSAQAQQAQAQAQPSGQAAGELPRTGFPAGLLALSGAAMLAVGAALRRRVG